MTLLRNERGETQKAHPPVGRSRSPPSARVQNSLTYAEHIDLGVDAMIWRVPFGAEVIPTRAVFALCDPAEVAVTRVSREQVTNMQLAAWVASPSVPKRNGVCCQNDDETDGRFVRRPRQRFAQLRCHHFESRCRLLGTNPTRCWG